MADFTARAAFLDAARTAQGAHPTAALQAEPPCTQFSFRGGTEAVSIAAQTFGVNLPLQACRAAQAAGRSALWLGPDEWLLLAPTDQANALRGALESALANVPCALVNVSNRNVALRISGQNAALVLNAGCPLDLSEAAFPVGKCTRTILAKAPILLWRLDARSFYIGTWRSFAPYVWDFLVEARTRL